MIDRRAFWIILSLATIMFAGAIWRVSLLSDWTLFPIEGGTTPRHSHYALFLFVPPIWLICYLGIVAGTRWLKRGAPQEIQPWKKWYSSVLIFGGVLMLAMQFFMIGRSLGIATTLDRMAVARAFIVICGIWMFLIGNRVPKLPWLASRLNILDLPPSKGAQLLRFKAWITVSIGVVYVLGGVFLPPKLLNLVLAATVVAALVMGLVRRIQLKNERLH